MAEQVNSPVTERPEYEINLLASMLAQETSNS